MILLYLWKGEVIYGEKGMIPEGEYFIPIGKAKVVQEGKDVTIVSFNKMMRSGTGRSRRVGKRKY